MNLLLGPPNRVAPWQSLTASVGFTQGQFLRTYAFSSPHGDGHYHHLVEPHTSPYRPLNFTRGKLTTRSATPVLLLLSPSQAHLFNRGTIVLVETKTGTGGLSKFAFWPNTIAHDPADFMVELVSTATAGGSNQDWGRVSAVFHPSSSAKYLGVGAKWLGVPPNINHYIKKVQVEKAYPGGTYPSPYESARQVNVVVRPDRINLAVQVADPVGAGTTIAENEAFNGGLWTRVSTTALDPSPVGVRTQADSETLRDGEYYVAQWVVANPTSTSFSVTANWCGEESFTTIILPGIQRRIYVVGNRRGKEYSDTFNYAELRVSPGAELLMKDVMIERGVDLNPFFNGSTGENTVWEGEVLGSRSHYYKDRLARRATLIRILESNVPAGIGIGEPQFGVTPKDW